MKKNTKSLSPSKSQVDNLLEHYQNKRYDEAEKVALIMTQKFPKHQFAWKVLGAVLKYSGRITESLTIKEKVVELSPQDFEAHYNLGNDYKELKRLEEAITSYKRAVMLKSDFAEAYSNLGNVLYELGRLDESQACYMRAITLKPDYAEAYSNLGVTAQQLGRIKEAEANCIKSIALKPEYAEAHSNLGNVLHELGRLNEAEASYMKAIALKPDYAEAYSNLGNVLKELSKLNEAKASFKQAITLKPDFTSGYSNLLFLYSGFMYEPSHYLEEARKYYQQIAASVGSKYSSWLCTKNSKNLRIGFVSGDLKNHPVGYLLEELLNQLRGSNLELYAYTTNLISDDLTLRIKPKFTRWQSIVGLSDEVAASKIHDDGIHILIDLSGHTALNRLKVFAWKPAPVQITWLGYFASTGVSDIDYILGDPYVTPVTEANHFSEKIWQLPESFLCFSEPHVDINIGPLPALNNQRVTFGCFTKIARINDQVILTWSKILHSVPDSVLFLKDKNFDTESVQNSFYDRFKLNGIQKERLILEGASPRSEYLAAYNKIDIALSPFPYGGGVTSAEGLWMGVPVITMKGNYFLSHLGESIACNSGLYDWIAIDQEDYVTKAVAFSSDIENLAKLRSMLRAQVLSSPLFDAKRFANYFEAALRKMWDNKNNHYKEEITNL
tara:strand:- start:237 stop:2240 length:2004 start_codon:yes stop_codon:yes gene_type:complete